MFRRRDKKKADVEVQLTALVDALTILLVFFMMQQTNGSEELQVKEKVQLPFAKNSYDTKIKDNVHVIINGDYLKVDEHQLLNLQTGRYSNSQLHEDDSEFISALHEKITDETEFADKKDHQWIVLADEKVPYETVKKTIYTLAISGYTNIKLAATTEGK